MRQAVVEIALARRREASRGFPSHISGTCLYLYARSGGDGYRCDAMSQGCDAYLPTYSGDYMACLHGTSNEPCGTGVTRPRNRRGRGSNGAASPSPSPKWLDGVLLLHFLFLFLFFCFSRRRRLSEDQVTRPSRQFHDESLTAEAQGLAIPSLKIALSRQTEGGRLFFLPIPWYRALVVKFAITIRAR
ncbi:hypothetical protein LZ30DRAFT_336306 [Colletotrichum cereale]|nr:hypothetical protein LZ30DRAFT_336306 [Colletotrichum cereale]